MSTIGRRPALAMPGGEGHGVRFADADVEEPVGKLVADRLEHVALAHGGGDDRDLRVGAHLRDGSRRWPRRCRRREPLFLNGTTDAVVARERGRRVEEDRVFGRRLEAVPLLRHHVQQHRPVGPA